MQRALAAGAVQAKLTVNQPGDSFEREADQVAREVTAGLPLRRDVPVAGVSPLIQKMCSDCEEELHRKAENGAASEASPAVENSVRSLRGGGQPIPEVHRSLFEQRFGRDFGDVRIHTGGMAARSAQMLDALAYTHGNDIVFAPGQYAPDTSSGRYLLAHELAHVVQQGGSDIAPLKRAPGGMLQRTCGSRDIGTRTGCTPGVGEPIGDLVLFTVNCDDYASAAEETKVVDFADSMTASDRVEVHGFASTDGDFTFNQNLSCARAERAAGTLTANGIPASQIDILFHGPTPGPAAQRRSVVLSRNPGASRPSVPQLTATITPGHPAPADCGGVNFVITWNLSRNSDATDGGFIIQDVTFVWSVRDCTGAEVANPDPRTSPLRYFEAWRVLPGTTTLTPVGTDTFSWPNAAPWAGGCTDGEVSITAVAQYHDAVSALPAHMVTPNTATFAGGLQSSLTDPALGGNVSRPFQHELSFHWVCCPCSSSPTVVDSHTP